MAATDPEQAAIESPTSDSGDTVATSDAPQKQLHGQDQDQDREQNQDRSTNGAAAAAAVGVGVGGKSSRRSTWTAWMVRNRIILATVALVVVVLVVVLPVCLVVLPRQGGDQSGVIRNAVIDLGYSQYQGSVLNSGVNQFLGMRFAAAPVGDLRWRAPVSPPETSGIQDATQFKPICLGIGHGYPVSGQDEDCLFVNVWSPTNATTASKLPVWLFIQGGGYTVNANANWNGAEVVQKSGNNIVMVNFNYRVGIWGFLASERVRQNGNLNAGMLDQRFLMQWVKTNIAQFGGDPDHVVIHGASAGAGSVALHMVAYGGRNDNLFVGGIAESIFFPAQPFVSELEWQFDRITQQTNCNLTDTTQQMTCLRGLNPTALQFANQAQPFPGRTGAPLPLFYFTPAVDGELLPDLPYNLYSEGKFLHMPILYGTTTDEGTIFADNAASSQDLAVFFANNYPKLTDNDTNAIIAQYPLHAALPNHASWFPSTEKAYGEATFICPGINTLNDLQAGLTAAVAQVPNGTNAMAAPVNIFSYRYNVQDDENTAEGLGVLHLFSSAAVFGPNNIGGSRPSYQTYNAAIVPVVMSYWISFVRMLDPNPYRDPSAPVWMPWGSSASRMVLETNNSRMEKTPQDELDRCSFWASLGGTLQQKRRRDVSRPVGIEWMA